jgi:hypothetical protein
MMVLPTAKGMLPEALPFATVVPFTVNVALMSVTVGVRVTELVVLPIEAV